MLTANFSTLVNRTVFYRITTVYGRQLTPKQSSERKTTLLTNECKSLQVYLREANNKQMPPRKQLIWMNCQIMNF